MKVYVQTYGCSFNQSDSEVMAGILKEAGHELTSLENAEIVIVNSCVVKNQTQKELFKFIEKAKESNKKIVVAGCAPSSIPEKLEGLSMIGVDQLNEIKDAVTKTANNEILVKIKPKSEKRFTLPKIRHNPIVEIIPISKGCLGSCTYCLTVNARGKLESYEGRAIKQAAEQAVKEGVKELWLTSQDTACWGMDIKQKLPRLIESLTHTNALIRVGMGNPNWFKIILPEFIEILKHPNVFKFVHIPVQAGDDEVLKNMKRGYSAKTYIDIVKKLKQEIPDITIATDIICGFPGETEEQFQKTLDIIKETRPPVMNVSKFAARPHTPAETMHQVEGPQIKDRSTRMATLHKEIRREELSKWVGRTCNILIDEKGKHHNQWVGRNLSYVPVIIEGDYKLGDQIEVNITSSHQHHVEGVDTHQTP
ncbi:MAG: tRNA (N(6)-L-threonylcarbamoyladenosine(37)-C(2))-methylthiotransferase [Candidatus Nanoarchaeia archaeon]